MSQINDIDNMVKLLKSKKQIILQGAPGVGKTYTTKELALRVMQDIKIDNNLARKDIVVLYNKAVNDKRIYFSTFHQSMDYEDFIEGYKPEENKPNSFVLRHGTFREACNQASKPENKGSKYVLIIDEINRGNVSKIFGELITLLEPDKREGMDEAIKATLTYSLDKFSVPNNLYIIGTMNTADRSLGQIDYALRRRFAFYTLKSNNDAITSYYENNSESPKDLALECFKRIKSFFDNDIEVNEDIEPDDIMIGHSYFMAKTIDEFKDKKKYEILPLIKEYKKDGIIAIKNDKKDIYDNLLEYLKG